MKSSSANPITYLTHFSYFSFCSLIENKVVEMHLLWNLFMKSVIRRIFSFPIIYPTKKKKEPHTAKLINFLKDCQCYNNFFYIILKACHCLLDCASFVSRSQKFVKKKTDGGQFIKCVFVMLSLRIKWSNANRLCGLKSSQAIVLWDSYFISDRTQLSAVGESMLCDYPMVVDYILEINLTKGKKI